MRVYRLHPITGKKYFPATDQQGNYVMGDPKHGGKKHLAANSIMIKDEEEMIRLLHKGFSIRITTDTRPSLIRKNLFVDGKPLV